MQLASLPEAERAAFLASMSSDEKLKAWFDWRGFWAREDQIPPTDSDWLTWFYMAGRGSGKTRAGAEWIREQVEMGAATRIALVGRTAADVRDVMVEGESGLLSVCPPNFRPRYIPSKRRLVWPNGAMATTYSAKEPDLLRGPQHDAAWADELAAWMYRESWDNLLLGLRLGALPRVVATSTPKPTTLIRELVKDPLTRVSHATTWANVMHLAGHFFDTVVARYAGTRLGLQELEGKLLEDVPGALWTRALIDKLRLDKRTFKAIWEKIVVAVDPAMTSGEDADETGIIVSARDTQEPAHGYVVDDLSGRYTPPQWGLAVVKAYRRYNANYVVAEANNGGEMVAFTIHAIDPNVPVKLVHASHGKIARAEPISALYEQGRYHHLGFFEALEDQMCVYTGDRRDSSPDRMDAMVYGAIELFWGKRKRRIIVADPGGRISPI